MGKLFFCPTEYCGVMAKPSVKESSYLQVIGNKLDPSIYFFWTGPNIISTYISPESIQELASVIKRKPVIWDNLHANDYDLRRFISFFLFFLLSSVFSYAQLFLTILSFKSFLNRIYLGPYDGRPKELMNEVEGILSNPNCEYEANFVPLKTLGLWINQSKHGEYDPRKALQLGIEEWFQEFGTTTIHNLEIEDINWLCDVFYLPHKHGDRAQKFLEQYKFILQRPSHHLGWSETVQEFLESCKRLIKLYEKLTEISNRGILYSIYNYIWETKEECAIISAYVQWLSGKKEKPFSIDAFPKIYRGGFVADLQRLLHFDEKGQFSPASASVSSYVIRPCLQTPEDEDGAYDVCLKTGNSGDDGTQYYNDPKVLGRRYYFIFFFHKFKLSFNRYAGPYVFLEPEFAFLLEDDIGICGYVFAAFDTASFYDRMRKEWIPKMKEIYPPNPPVIEGKRDHEIIASFYDENLPYPEVLHAYPSHLHIDLIERAQGKHLGTKMIQLILV